MLQMLLKNVLFRRGIAFLEPNTVVLKGYQTDDREANQDADFARGLRLRMGCMPFTSVRKIGWLTETIRRLQAEDPRALPIQPAQAPAQAPQPPAPQPPAPRPVGAPAPGLVSAPASGATAAPVVGPSAQRPTITPRGRNLPSPVNPRPAFRELSPSAMEALFAEDGEDMEMLHIDERRRVPAGSAGGSTLVASTVASGSRAQAKPTTSPYWPSDAATSTLGAGPSSSRSQGPLPTTKVEPLFLPSPSPEHARAQAPSSDFDEEMLLDASVLAELDKVERAVVSSGSSIPSSSVPSGSASGSGASSGSVLRPGRGTSVGVRASAPPTREVIMVASDEEDENADKENMPAPVLDRRVRRRMADTAGEVPPLLRARARTQATVVAAVPSQRARSETMMTDDVIDLSD
jgi:RecQ-mediated genome instability protein 1